MSRTAPLLLLLVSLLIVKVYQAWLRPDPSTSGPTPRVVANDMHEPRKPSPNARPTSRPTPHVVADDMHEPREPAPNARTETTGVDVETSPKALAAARALAARTRPTVQQILKSLENDDAMDIDVRDDILDVETWKSSILPSVRKFAADASRPPQARIKSVSVLLALGQKGAVVAIVPLVRHPDASVRSAALRAIADGHLDATQPQLLAALDDVDGRVRQEAIIAVAGLRIAGHVPALARRMQTGDPLEAAIAARALAREGAVPQDVLKAAAQALQHPDPRAAFAWIEALQALAGVPDPTVRAQALSALEGLTGRADLPETDRGEAILALAKHATASRGATLQRLYRETAAKESRTPREVISDAPLPMAGLLMEAMVRTRGAAAVQADLVKALDDEHLSQQAALAIATIAPDRVEPATLAALRHAIASTEREYLLEELGYALCQVGGPQARAEVEAVAQRLDKSRERRSGLQWVLRGYDLATALDRLAKIGVIAAAPPPDAIRRWSAEPENLWRSPDPYVLFGFLETRKVVAHFDTETGTLPVRHDRLLRDLAGISGGRFVPTAVTQAWLRSADDDEDAPYRLTFIHNNRVYRVECENHGDWYDVETVLTVANRAVADAGLPHRFTSLYTGDQTASIIFATPQAVARAVDEQILTADPDAAPEARGKDFEKQVRDRLHGNATP